MVRDCKSPTWCSAFHPSKATAYPSTQPPVLTCPLFLLSLILTASRPHSFWSSQSLVLTASQGSLTASAQSNNPSCCPLRGSYQQEAKGYEILLGRSKRVKSSRSTLLHVNWVKLLQPSTYLATPFSLGKVRVGRK